VVSNGQSREQAGIRRFALNDETLTDLNDYALPASHWNAGNLPFAERHPVRRSFTALELPHLNG
jgi:hypothetical protein